MKLKETLEEKKCQVARWWRIHGKPIIIGTATTIGGMAIAYAFGRSVPHYSWEGDADVECALNEIAEAWPEGVVFENTWDNTGYKGFIRQDISEEVFGPLVSENIREK